MRRNSLAILAACAAVTIGGQARAQQPAATPAPVPDQMPFDIPYGNSITADRAAEIVKAVVAEATKSPRNWKLAISVVDTAWRTGLFLQDGQHADGIGDDLAEQGPLGGAFSPSDADIQQRDANSRRRLYRHTELAAADGISRRLSRCRGRQDHRRGRLQRRTGDQDAVACKAGADR